MKLKSCLFAVLALFANASIAQINPQPALTPLYSAYNASLTDNFYTVSQQQLNSAVGSYGYSDTGILAYMEKTQQTNTRPFKRFYKGAPQFEHFYTASASEESAVLAAGWVAEGIEGYIYNIQVPGSVPMYRASKYNGSTGDLVHKYVVNYSDFYYLIVYQGWSSDGIQGYVYTKSNPEIPGGIVVGLRCPNKSPGYCRDPNKAILPNYRDYYFRTGNAIAAATTKTGATQRIRVKFKSWDFFSDSNHLVFSMHGRFSAGSPNPLNICASQSQISSSCTWHRGLGMIFYGQPTPLDPIRPANQVFTQAWMVGGGGGGLRAATDTPIGSSLVNNRLYSADIRVSDSGYIAYSITDTTTNSVIKSDAWNASGHFTPSSPFPVELTGYMVGDANDSARDFTLYITEFSVDWIP